MERDFNQTWNAISISIECDFMKLECDFMKSECDFPYYGQCLETLTVFYISIEPEDIKFIVQCCPRLKYFKIKTWSMESDGDALSLANTLSTLRELGMFGSRAILLHGCASSP
ncbi:hypothetical protein OSB04_002018 [Centaurea solstitialis]|uniref:Uncharacterized protein n=1 Tax=Centaurea solstitialis TaxID=347529 RepID=A0AA38UA54_9ASTR|nr:hypothetical protein OSB04_002018 [Centaurea solstitialis]